MFEKVCIFGVGLIGGSLARAARGAGVFKHIVGCSRSEQHLQKALELGVIDSYTTDARQAVTGADLIILAVPLGAMRVILTQIKDHVSPDCVITDVGSAKASVISDVRDVFGQLPPRFVPGHPIAGTENSGVQASFAELFENRQVILTPLNETDPEAISQVSEMWHKTGANVVSMSVAHHDEILAATSHLPHFLAFTLVDTLANLKEHDEIFKFAAGGFRDFTRIASSDPEMWRDICLHNRSAVLKMLERFKQDFENLLRMIESKDSDGILALFKAAKSARDKYTENSN